MGGGGGGGGAGGEVGTFGGVISILLWISDYASNAATRARKL